MTTRQSIINSPRFLSVAEGREAYERFLSTHRGDEHPQHPSEFFDSYIGKPSRRQGLHYIVELKDFLIERGEDKVFVRQMTHLLYWILDADTTLFHASNLSGHWFLKDIFILKHFTELQLPATAVMCWVEIEMKVMAKVEFPPKEKRPFSPRGHTYIGPDDKPEGHYIASRIWKLLEQHLDAADKMTGDVWKAMLYRVSTSHNGLPYISHLVRRGAYYYKGTHTMFDADDTTDEEEAMENLIQTITLSDTDSEPNDAGYFDVREGEENIEDTTSDTSSDVMTLCADCSREATTDFFGIPQCAEHREGWGVFCQHCQEEATRIVPGQYHLCEDHYQGVLNYARGIDRQEGINTEEDTEDTTSDTSSDVEGCPVCGPNGYTDPCYCCETGGKYD